jgi:WD40 repeat protein/curved DNA-binding protein CbpA
MPTKANDRKRRARSIASAFRVLRLDVGASAAEVKSAYKTLARAHHPDKTGGDADAFREIQEAYEKILAKHERDRVAMAAMDAATRDGGDSGRRAASEGAAARRGESDVTVLELRQGEDGAALTRGGDLKQLGDERFEAGEYDTAIECYTAAAAYAKVDGTAEYAELYHARGSAYERLERWREAIDDADRAIGVRALWSPPWLLKGRALEASGAWSRAADVYRECVERIKSKDGDEETTRRFLDGLKRAEAKATTQDRMAEVKAHRGPVIGMAMKPAPANAEDDVSEPVNAYVATIGADRYLRIFSVPQGECLYSEKFSVDVKTFRWCPTGSGALVVNGANGFVRFCEFECASRGTPRATLASSHDLVGFPDHVDTTAVAIDVTGEYVAVGSNDGSICVWDAAHATLDRAIPAGLNAHKLGITSLSFHPVFGRAQLTSGSLDGDGRVWDLAGEATEVPGECLHTLRWNAGAVVDVNYLACGRLIVTSTSSTASEKTTTVSTNRLLVWSSVSGRLCKWYDAHESRVTAFTWHPYPGSRNLAVTGCDDGVLRMWSIRAAPSGAGKPLRENDEHAGRIAETHKTDVRFAGAALDVAFSPTGGLLAAVTRDGYLHVHDSDTLETTSSWRVTEEGSVTSVAWSPAPVALRSGERLDASSPWMVVTGDDAGRVCVWRVARGADESNESDESDEGEDDTDGENAVASTSRRRALLRSSNGVFTSRDVKTWWDAEENASEVTPRVDVEGWYLGPSPEDKPIHKAMRLGNAPEQTHDPRALTSSYVDLTLRDGESATREAYDEIDAKIRDLQRAREAYMRDPTNTSADKRAYGARFAADMEPLRARRSRVYAGLKTRDDAFF